MEGKDILWSDILMCGSEVAVLLTDSRLFSLSLSFSCYLLLTILYCFIAALLPHAAGYPLKDLERMEYFLISRWKLPLSIPASLDAWVTFPLCLVSMLVI